MLTFLSKPLSDFAHVLLVFSYKYLQNIDKIWGIHKMAIVQAQT